MMDCRNKGMKERGFYKRYRVILTIISTLVVLKDLSNHSKIAQRD
jgi:hypothetical protein